MSPENLRFWDNLTYPENNCLLRFIDETLLIPRDDSLSRNKLGSRKADVREGQALPSCSNLTGSRKLLGTHAQ
jgi:hypothetical protein